MNNSLTIADEYTPEQKALIINTVAKGATKDEFALFLYRCKHLDLDPLKPGQIYFIKYENSPGTIIIGIDGFRSKAGKTKKHTGTNRGVIRDETGKCVGAYCEVHRSDWAHPAREEVSLAEYNTKRGQWAKMPETMIKKVAEVAALRMAFPDELGGLYSDDEMAQVETSEIKVAEHEQISAVVENIEPGKYAAKFGKFKGQALESLDIYELNSYVAFIEKSAKEKGKTIQGDVAEFMTNATEYLDSKSPKPSEGIPF